MHLLPSAAARLFATAFLGAALTLLLSSAGAAASEEVVELPVEPITIDVDTTTQQLVLGTYGPNGGDCVQYHLTVIGLDGQIAWELPEEAACSWLVDEGTLYVSAAGRIRSFDMATGTRERVWTLDENIVVREMFATDIQLYFNQRDVSQRPAVRRVGSVPLAVDNDAGQGAFPGSELVATSSDGRFLWLADDEGLTRFDQSGDTANIVMPRTTLIHWQRSGSRPVLLSADETLLYIDGAVFDAATLEPLTTLDQRDPVFSHMFELSNGSMVGIGSGFYRYGPVVHAPGTVDPIASHRFTGNDASSPMTVADDLVYVALERSTLAVYPIVPALGSFIKVAAMDAGTARTVRMSAFFIDAIDTISIDGQPVAFRPVDADYNGTTDWLDVDLPALSAGTHRLVFDGPLGRSFDDASNDIVITPALNRSQLDVLIRSDSRGGEVTAFVACSDPSADVEQSPPDIVITETLRSGDRLSLTPLVGDTCNVTVERVQSADLPLGSFNHLTAGRFDPVTDPNGWGTIDIYRPQLEVAMTNEPVGFAVFIPNPDETVLWTYAYGFGQVPDGERTVTIDCEGTEHDATYRTFYNYWYRSVIPAQGCQVTHPAPTGSVFSGWGEVIPELRELGTVYNDNTSRYVSGSDPVAALYTLDVYPHPSEHNGAFARQQYLDFLGRPGDPGGLRFWEDALNSGTRGRTDLVKLFLDSPEFGGTVAPVNRLYLAYFDRAPDRAGLFFWVNWIRDGRTLGQVSDEFARSPEFAATYGSLSDEAFIDLVYQNVLGRLPDSAGRAFWVDRMAAGVTRGQVMASFSESPEYIEQTEAAVLVESLYQGLLQRSPDAEGFAFWVGQVEAGASIDTLIAGMLASDEYFNRFDNVTEELPTGSARQQLFTFAE